MGVSVCYRRWLCVKRNVLLWMLYYQGPGSQQVKAWPNFQSVKQCHEFLCVEGSCGMKGLVTACIWMLLLHLSWGRAIIRDQHGNPSTPIPNYTSSEACFSAFRYILLSVTYLVITMLAFFSVVIQCSCRSNQPAFSYHALFFTTPGILSWWHKETLRESV